LTHAPLYGRAHILTQLIMSPTFIPGDLELVQAHITAGSDVNLRGSEGAAASPHDATLCPPPSDSCFRCRRPDSPARSMLVIPCAHRPSATSFRHCSLLPAPCSLLPAPYSMQALHPLVTTAFPTVISLSACSSATSQPCPTQVPTWAPWRRKTATARCTGQYSRARSISCACCWRCGTCAERFRICIGYAYCRAAV
jgi:hypothetical protein